MSTDTRKWFKEPYMAAADTVWVDDDFVEIGETTEAVEEVPEDTFKQIRFTAF